MALRPFWQRAERAKRRTVLSRGVAMMTDVNARLQVWISLECKADEKRTARVLIAWSAWLDDERIVEKKMRWAASKWSKLAERYGFDAWYEEASKRAVLDDCMTRWRQGMVGRAMNLPRMPRGLFAGPCINRPDMRTTLHCMNGCQLGLGDFDRRSELAYA